MKTLQKLLILAFIMVLIVSCSEKDDGASSDKTFSVEPESVGFNQSSGRRHVNITCDGVWTAEISGSWATVSPSTGSGDGEIDIDATHNYDDQTRSCTVTISSAGESKYVSVIQKPY